ncbi:hypothetical protein FB446DRAFT_723344 [Lentinula raphanica]|nr:hypothetical protein FB446DRAFT_723344 [Lentinula raphanica]
MQPHLSLPDELLHVIIEYTAYNPQLPHSHSTSVQGFKPACPLFKSASSELFALSVANWRLRRICLPLLFANIRIKHIKDAQQLEIYISLLTRFTKIIFIKPINSVIKAAHELISQNLPRFTRLFYVELPGNQTALLRTLLAHPTITSVMVHELPGHSMCKDDLSKIIYSVATLAWATSPRFEEYLNQGMRLARLQLFDSLDNIFGPKIFCGLEEIRLHLGDKPISFSFLSVLSSTYPTLNEFWLFDNDLRYFTRHTPPFMSSFIENSQRQGLRKSFVITHVCLGRASRVSSQWYVMGLALKITLASPSLVEILALIASSFPKLQNLDLNLDGHEATYHVHDFVTAFKEFSSLRMLFLSGAFKRLDFGSDKLLPPVRPLNSTVALDALIAHAETGTLWYTSRIANEARSLESFYIREESYETQTDIAGQAWHLIGLFHVMNGNRDIRGTIIRVATKAHYSNILLETRMLPPGLVAMEGS